MKKIKRIPTLLLALCLTLALLPGSAFAAGTFADVSDTANSAVRQIKGGTVSTVAQRDWNDLTSYIPSAPAGLTVHGNQLYVCDSFARKVFVISLA